MGSLINGWRKGHLRVLRRGQSPLPALAFGLAINSKKTHYVRNLT